MLKRLASLGGTAALAAVLSVSAAAAGEHDVRGCAIMSPLDSPDVDSNRFLCHRYGYFVPYYGSPLTPISTRWRPIVYVPYYCGYCRPHVRYAYPPYGDGGAGLPAPGCNIGSLPGVGTYGPYTRAPRDEATLLHLGGNAPYPPPVPGGNDILDGMRGGSEPAGPARAQ